MRSCAPIAAFLVSLLPHVGARAQGTEPDLDVGVLAVAPGPGGTFWSLAPNGHVRRRDESGGVVEDLGRAAPFEPGLDAIARVEAFEGGVMVASRAGLVRVTGGSSGPVVTPVALGRQAGSIVDFAVDATGRRLLFAASVSGRNVDVDAVFALEGGALRQLVEGPSGARVALDAAGRTAVVIAGGSSVVAGRLKAFDFETGALLWEVSRCRGPLLRFLDERRLAGCLQVDDGDVGGVAIYDARTGRVVRRFPHIDRAYATSPGGARLLYDDPLAETLELRVLDMRTGRSAALNVTWSSEALGWWASARGVVLPDHRVIMPAWRRLPLPPFALHVGDAPWVMGRRASVVSP